MHPVSFSLSLCIQAPSTVTVGTQGPLPEEMGGKDQNIGDSVVRGEVKEQKWRRDTESFWKNLRAPDIFLGHRTDSWPHQGYPELALPCKDLKTVIFRYSVEEPSKNRLDTSCIFELFLLLSFKD